VRRLILKATVRPCGHMAHNVRSRGVGGHHLSLPRRSVLMLVGSAGVAAACGGGTEETNLPVVTTEPLPENSPARPFVGTYKFAGGDPERVAVDRAIDGVVSEMSGLVRGIARGRLADANRVAEELILLGGGNTFAVLVDKRAYTGRLDGTAVKVKTVTGDMMDMRFEVGPQLAQIFTDEEKGRTNRFELRGEQLIMHVRVHASALPRDLLYDLTYTRAD
jgi:hypothetical protein